MPPDQDANHTAATEETTNYPVPEPVAPSDETQAEPVEASEENASSEDTAQDESSPGSVDSPKVTTIAVNSEPEIVEQPVVAAPPEENSEEASDNEAQTISEEPTVEVATEEPAPLSDTDDTQPETLPLTTPVGNTDSTADVTNEVPVIAPDPVADQTETPDTSPIVSSSDQAPQIPIDLPTQDNGKRSKKKLLLGLIIVILIIILGGGYVFAVYLPSTPSGLYSTGLKNTGTAVDKLITYSQSQETAGYKSYAINGSVNVKSSSISFDGTFNGAYDSKDDSNVSIKADVLGENITLNERSIKTAGNSSPDVYIQATGIKNLLDESGLTSLGSLDGQWIVIDHTLLETYATSLKKSASSTNATGTGLLSSSTLPTYAEINDAENKVQSVNKQYLFTTNQAKAVITKDKYIGSSTLNGRSSREYLVNYNKTNFAAYLGALGTALDSSSLNNWATKADSGKSLSGQLNVTNLQKQIESYKGKYSFDLWIDTKTKLVSKMQFSDPTNASETLTIAQSYSGSGGVYPLQLAVSDKTKGVSESTTLNLVINSTTHQVTATITGSGNGTTVNATAVVAPSTKDITVTAPTGAQPIINILSSLGLSGSSVL